MRQYGFCQFAVRNDAAFKIHRDKNKHANQQVFDKWFLIIRNGSRKGLKNNKLTGSPAMPLAPGGPDGP